LIKVKAIKPEIRFAQMACSVNREASKQYNIISIKTIDVCIECLDRKYIAKKEVIKKVFFMYVPQSIANHYLFTV
jgi:hypothetical protein